MRRPRGEKNPPTFWDFLCLGRFRPRTSFFFFANSSQGFLFQLGVLVGAQWSARLPRDREGEGSTPSASIALPILDSMYGLFMTVNKWAVVKMV